MNRHNFSFSLPSEGAFAELDSASLARLETLGEAWMQRINLSRKHTEQMRQDLVSAMARYLSQKLCPQEIEKRLNPEKIGYFYYEEPEEWYPLDTAATIYPLSMRRNWMPIFRLSAYLNEPVIPELLQIALSIVICRFPYFSVTLGKGFFWYYLDSTRRHFRLKEESKKPFSVMNLAKFNSPCFRVMYYQNRISVEYFHLLTDGTGGTIFLKTLLGEYFRLLGKQVPATCGLFDLSAPVDPRECANDFHLAEPTKASGFAGKRARQLKGALSASRPHQILHFEMDAEKLHRAAKERNSTVTAYLLTHFFFACKNSLSPGKGNVQIQVPCNMRKYYPSKTMRNFAMYCILGRDPNSLLDFDTALKEIGEDLQKETSKEALTQQMLAGTKLVSSLRFVPLFLKAPLTRYFYPYFSDLILTTTLSNLGVVEMPEEIAALIDKFDFILGTTVQNRATCSLITYKNKAVLSIFKATAHPGFEEALYTQLKNDGITPIVTGSQANGFHRCLSEN